MAKINNITSYPISTPVTGSDIVIGSITGSGGDTANFLMSGIATYMTGQISLANVCSVGSTTATTMDIADTLTLSKASGTGLAVTANATIGGRLTITGTGLGNGLVVSGDGSVGGTFGVVGITTLTGALDANSTADIADTLTLSKATGTGLQVDANATIDGILSLTRTGGAGLSVTDGVNIGGGIECYGLHHQWGALTVESTATFNNKIVLNGSAPATATSTGEVGQIAVDTDYIYVCTATDTWKRVAIATW